MPKKKSRLSITLNTLPKWLIQLSIILLAAGLAYFAFMVYLNFSLATFLAIPLSTSIPLLCLGTLAALLVIVFVRSSILAVAPYFSDEKRKNKLLEKAESSFKEMLTTKTMVQIDEEATTETLDQLQRLLQTPAKSEALLELWFAEEKRQWDLYQANKKNNPKQAVQHKYTAQDCWRKLHSIFLKMPTAFSADLLDRLKQRLASSGVDDVKETKDIKEEAVEELTDTNLPPDFKNLLEKKSIGVWQKGELRRLWKEERYRESYQQKLTGTNLPSSLEALKQEERRQGYQKWERIQLAMIVANGAPIREKYSVEQQLKRLFSLPQPAVFAPATGEKKNPQTIPLHLRPWVQELTLTHQQDQHHVQQHSVSQQQEQDLQADLDLSAEEEVLLLVDNSNVSIAEWQSEQGFLVGSHWFSPLVQQVFAESDRCGLLNFKIADLSYDQRSKLFHISDQAKEAMLSASNLRFNIMEDDFDLHNLPQGFFVELHPDQAGFILKFDPEWSNKIKHKTHSALLIKPTKGAFLQKDNQGRVSWVNKKYLSLTEQKDSTKGYGIEIPIYEEMKQERSIQYWEDAIPDAKEFPENWESLADYEKCDYRRAVQEKWYGKLGLSSEQQSFLKSQSNRLPMVALVQISKQSQPEDTRRFIEFMLGLKKRKSSRSDADRFGGPLYLAFFYPYWKNNLACNWTHHLSTLESILDFSDQEFFWFEALTCDGADIEEVVHGLIYFFQFFKDKGLELPTVMDALDLHVERRAVFNQLKNILDCISLSEAQTLQMKWLSQLPKALTRANTQLRAGYLVIHKAMCFDKDCTEAFNKRFPQLKDPYWITREELKAIDYLELKEPEKPRDPRDQAYETNEQLNYRMIVLRNPLLYRALFLRYSAAHLDAENFHKAVTKWEELMDEKLTTLEDGESNLFWLKKGDQAKLSPLAEKLALRWPKMKNFILSLPTKMALEEKEKPEWLLERKFETSRLYETEDLAAVLGKMGINSTLQASLIQDIKYLNQQATQMASDYKEFQRAIDEFKQLVLGETKQSEQQEEHQKMLQQLVLMREAHFRLSKKKDAQGKTIKSGEWLRREQALAILLDYYSGHNRLYRIMTDEGKTFILQLIAMGLQGKKVDVITHNESLAAASYAALQSLARFFNIKVAHHKMSSDEEKAKADILYTDIANAVIAHQRGRLAESNPKDSKSEQEIQTLHRKAEIALVDEVDNVIIDIHADTTMQISIGSGEEADPTLQAFLLVLNTVVRETLSSSKESDKAAQRAIVVQAIQKIPSARSYYEQHCEKKSAVIDRWISAAVTAMGLKEKQDYVIEQDRVRIVHKDTTGRVDKISQWGKGVHQCVAAWEKCNKGHHIKIPTLSRVIAEGNVLDYLRTQYTSVSGFTGTLGEAEVQEQIEASLLKEEKGRPPAFVIPPAKRTVPKGAAWPQIPISSSLNSTEDPKEKKEEKREENQYQKKTKIQYKRFYSFPAQIFESENDHLEGLLTAIRNTQEQNYSAIIFFNTIQECEDMYQFSIANGIDPRTLQILDDTSPDEKAGFEAKSLRPGEATAIDQAKKPRMITFTTAAGGRGTNFHGITVGIAARPGLLRVLIQAEGRIARHSELAIFYEMYWKGDMLLRGETLSKVTKKLNERSEVKSSSENLGFDFFMENWRKAKQQGQLRRIEARSKLDKFKQKQQNQFLSIRARTTKEKLKQLDDEWMDYFSNLCWQDQESEGAMPAPFRVPTLVS